MAQHPWVPEYVSDDYSRAAARGGGGAASPVTPSPTGKLDDVVISEALGVAMGKRRHWGVRGIKRSRGHVGPIW